MLRLVQGQSLCDSSGSFATRFLPGCSELQQLEEWLWEATPTWYLPVFSGFFFPAVIYTVKKERAWKSKLSSAADYIASVLSHYLWSTRTWSYATVYYQALLAIKVPGAKVKGELGHLQ